MLSQHVLLFAAIVWFVLLLVRQCTPVQRDISPEPIRVRRHSVETICTLNNRQRKRRPSEEAGASSTPMSAPPVLNSPFIFSNRKYKFILTYLCQLDSQYLITNIVTIYLLLIYSIAFVI